MITIKVMNVQDFKACRIVNEPFSLMGRVQPSYQGGQWVYEIDNYSQEQVSEMCFPDEVYDDTTMPETVFIGAYDGEACIGVAVLQPGYFKYMYLYDFKVNQQYRRQQVGTRLIDKAKQIAASQGYCGLYTQVQDNNVGAFRFYMRVGFYIGGLDIAVYQHTPQEGKYDILLYCENEER